MHLKCLFFRMAVILFRHQCVTSHMETKMSFWLNFHRHYSDVILNAKTFPCHWPLWNPPVTVIGGFPSQRASNAEFFSIWWRHHENDISISVHRRNGVSNHQRVFTSYNTLWLVVVSVVRDSSTVTQVAIFWGLGEETVFSANLRPTLAVWLWNEMKE